jgi:hypothetical protein
MNGDKANAWAEGVVVGSAALMMIMGLNHFLIGLAAVFQDQVFVRTVGYLYAFDLTTWGWLHLVLGAVVALLGGFILTGKDWARATGVAVVSLALVLNSLWLPYAPVWTVIQIALGVIAIWGLVSWTPRRSLI